MTMLGHCATASMCLNWPSHVSGFALTRATESLEDVLRVAVGRGGHVRVGGGG
ncbi:hypothetical protein ACIF80_09070 [Streptomyces sp. NPDC085927]|uniref:hypothetical protein n=1 Tax=Streptomyces sp. NPDC085927 TaxID=3365738 RepID=UPI0037D468A7